MALKSGSEIPIPHVGVVSPACQVPITAIPFLPNGLFPFAAQDIENFDLWLDEIALVLMLKPETEKMVLKPFDKSKINL